MSENNVQKTNINWFPGHMAKARREMSEKIKLVDLIIEIRDGRIPFSSQNPLLKELAGNKPRMIVLSKADKAEKTETAKWVEYFKEQGYYALALDLIHNHNVSKIISEGCNSIMSEKIAKLKAKGMRNVEIKAMVVGIPNVGKSTLINAVSNKKATQTADRPGVTKNLQWIKVSPSVALLDTPGVLWPKFEDELIAYRLAVTGAINDNVLPLDAVCNFALDYLKTNYADLLTERYKIDAQQENHDIIRQIAQNRGWLINDAEINYDRFYALFLKEIRDNQIGCISWEKCDADGE